MTYPEFSEYQIIEDKANPFSTLYQLPSGERFYIEPGFYTQLMGFKEFRGEDFPRIMERMIEIIKKNKKVIFTASYEYPQTDIDVDEYILLEIYDITDPLKIYVEDKSRGSDYGD
ncbi:MAG: hypothetical protein LUC16_00595 [Coprobacillus sp.]|nr:hypothetical protein [Coprobacillus sp.]